MAWSRYSLRISPRAAPCGWIPIRHCATSEREFTAERAKSSAFGGPGQELHNVAENLIELWVVAKRRVEQNGLGMTPRRRSKSAPAE
ncbi:hypothetical protein SBA3_1250045 [Candidatus Sulfopaludibacter sp. SbA3]|nr:hypothetical protein SBA3_1250045 [Candidatus Sulfopaludibacter sp. SbA3]